MSIAFLPKSKAIFIVVPESAGKGVGAISGTVNSFLWASKTYYRTMESLLDEHGDKHVNVGAWVA